MRKYTLIGFQLRGLGEYMRLLFEDNEIPFENVAHTAEEWPTIKHNYPYSQLPILKDGDIVIPQTGAIMRHLARAHNLYGSTDVEKTYLDVFFEGLRDLRSKYSHMVYNDYEHKEQYVTETLPVELARIEKMFRTHKNGEAFVLGDQISFADYVFFEELDIAQATAPGSLDKFPTLKAFYERFKERPNIKKHLATRFKQINIGDRV